MVHRVDVIREKIHFEIDHINVCVTYVFQYVINFY